MKDLSPLARDTALSELDLAAHHIARREIEAFCAVCQFHPRPPCAVTAQAPATSG